MKRRPLAVLAGAALMLLVLAFLGLRQLAPDQQELIANAGKAHAVTATDLRARYAVLSKQHSNQCGLRASSLETLAEDGRLQGACCSAMEYVQYRRQMQGLKRYGAVPEIPKDPYDVSVSLAKRLIGYRTAITLDSSQQAIYDRATELATEHGPCCCHCWRWDAFEGQAKFLIARRNYASNQIAQLWDLENGCGGGRDA